jgi:hypothetical protein
VLLPRQAGTVVTMAAAHLSDRMYTENIYDFQGFLD